MFKKVVVFSLVLVLGMAGHIFYLYTHRVFGPGDFNHTMILSREPSVPNDDVKREASEIVRQRFVYLGRGGQMTAYESADGKYVIKFFNPRSLINKTWFHRVPKLLLLNSRKWIFNTYFRKKERLEKYFRRCEMSFNDLKEETGLIYIHVDPATKLSQTVELVGKNGHLYHIDLDTNPFVLQKKVELTLVYIDNLMGKGKIDEAKEAARQIHALFLSRAQKGYTDRVQAIEKNFGFVDGRAVQFDTGRICKKEDVLKNPQKEVKRVIANIKPSLDHYPELIAVLEEFFY